MSDLTIDRHDAAGLRDLRDELLDAYAEIYADEIAHDEFFSVDRFWERLGLYSARDGFALVTGRLDGELVGYALGNRLRTPGTGWWRGFKGEINPPDLLIEDGHRTFAVNEIMVRDAYRRRGYARQLHDALLEDRPEARDTLTVEPDNPARLAYLAWGWRKVGTVKPFEDSPEYEVMLYDLRRP
jgi:ribosomal protein S18 acetylase RimI-like enzyme